MARGQAALFALNLTCLIFPRSGRRLYRPVTFIHHSSKDCQNCRSFASMHCRQKVNAGVDATITNKKSDFMHTLKKAQYTKASWKIRGLICTKVCAKLKKQRS